MEEARQHPALTPEQRLFSAIYLGGWIILSVALCLQMFWRIDALYPAILLVGSTRIILDAWQLSRPKSFNTLRTRSGLVFTMVAWACAVVLVIWARIYGAGT